MIKILSRKRYRSLLRAAHDQMVAAGRSDITFGVNRTAMLIWRLSGGKIPSEHELLRNPFEFIATHDTDDETIIFVVHNGEALVTKEPMENFPSDTLVAQLRLLL